MQKLEVGQRVAFRLTHQPEIKLTGKVLRADAGDECVDVLADQDGKVIEVDNFVHTLPARDCKVIEEAVPAS